MLPQDFKEQPEPLVALFASAVVISCLHALPIPAKAAAWIAPSSYANAVAIARGLGLDEPGWIAFSQDPAGTWERVLYAVAVFCAFCCSRIVSKGTRGTTILTCVAVSTALVAISHLSHRMVDAERVYGLYLPAYTKAYGPILNPNNLAGFLSFGLPISVAMGLHYRGARRWAWFVISGTVAATGLLAGSRAGAVTIVAGPAIFGLLHWARSRRRRAAERQQSERALEEVVFVLSLLAVGFGLAELAADDFLDVDYRDLTKVHLLEAQAAAFFRDPFAVVGGVGRGAFRIASASSVPAAVRVMHAECFPFQYAVEYGVPITFIFLIVLIWRIAAGFRRAHSVVQLGGWVGILVLGLQNLVDFGVEMTGLAVPAAAALGACLPQRQRVPREETPDRPWHWGVVVACCAALSIGLGVPAARHDILRVERRLKEFLEAGTSDQFWTLFQATIKYHPADPELASLAAYYEVSVDADDAPFWLNRAMRLSPSLGKPHLLAAHWLAKQGRWSQAESELAAVSELDSASLMRELCMWLLAKPRADFALTLAPALPAARHAFLNEAARCLAGSHPEQSSRIDAQLLRVDPQSPFAHLRSARRLIAQGAFDEAIRETRQVRARLPTYGGAAEVEALALLGAGRATEAVQVLSEVLPRVENPWAILIGLANAQASANDAHGMRDTIDRLRILAAGDARRLSEVQAHLSECERLLGNDARAFKAISDARRLDDRKAYRHTAASLAAKLGQFDYARRTYEGLCREEPTNQVYCDPSSPSRGLPVWPDGTNPGPTPAPP